MIELKLKFAWMEIGEIAIDALGKLCFPKTENNPGLYRFNVCSGTETRVYVGETDMIRRRFQHYRTPGVSQDTNIRINALISEVLRGGGSVGIATIASGAVVSFGNEDHILDFRLKSQRRMLENAALLELKLRDVRVLNLG